jgi:DNA-binding beta-propeller fold protein YncE
MPQDLNIVPGVWGRIFGVLKGGRNTRIIRPYGLEMDSQGRLFVVDTFLRLVHVFYPQKSVYYTFPKGRNGFISPIDVALDRKGLIYVSDSEGQVVKIFKDNGKTFVRNIGQGILERPTGLAVNEKTNELLVLDTVLSSIFRYDLSDYHVKGVIGKIGKGKDAFLYPTNIFVSKEGNIYVSDSMNFRIKVLSPEGKLLHVFGQSGDSPGYFSSPKGVAVDSEGHIYVVDGMFDNIQIFDREGRLLMAFGSPGSNPGEFWLPSGIFIDGKDRIYVADSYNQRIQVFHYIKEEGEIS